MLENRFVEVLRRNPQILQSILITALILGVLVVEKFIAGSSIFLAVRAISADFDNAFAQFIFEYGKAISRIATLAMVIFAVLAFRRLPNYRDEFLNQNRFQQLGFLIIQLALFYLFYRLVPVLLTPESSSADHLIWLTLGILAGIFALFSLASPKFWGRFFRYEYLFLLISIALSAGVWMLGSSTQHLWSSMSEATFFLVSVGLSIFDHDVYMSVEGGDRIIGVNDFLVDIAIPCSGYEGIGLITAFTGVYLYSFKKDFRFPQAFLLFPLAALIIWLFNALRIIILIMIGAYWSPDTAVLGFHTQAGWISFIIASVLVMWLAHHSKFFTRANAEGSANTPTTKQPLSLPIATLIPLITLLSATLLTQALSGHFDWLYPLRVLLTAGALVYCWRALQFRPVSISYWSVIGGVLVTILWIFAVPAAPETDQIFQETFSNSPTFWVGLWLIFRFIGTAITVPIAEELGFRAYLLCRLSSQPVVIRGSIPFSLIGFAVSSLAFGLLHGAWIAGTLAGLVYAVVRYRSSHIADAMVAHGLTNALLFGYALYSGRWSLL
jgi:exosortase E/protease (VPEID-CTERM system)